MSLFRNDENILHFKNEPRCSICEDRGFVGCDDAISSIGGVYFAIAWGRGLPCSCAAGEDFAIWQKRWREISTPRPETFKKPESKPAIAGWEAIGPAGTTYDPNWWADTVRSVVAAKQAEKQTVKPAERSPEDFQKIVTELEFKRRVSDAEFALGAD